MILLSADWHLDDKQLNEYRWSVFDTVEKLVAEHKPAEIVLLGDIFDTKDRHPSSMVNRFVDGIEKLSLKARVYVLMGNHDMPRTGRAYWTYLSKLKNVRYITKPTRIADKLFLPFSPDPVTEWKDIVFDNISVVFMHQPIDGACQENGTRYVSKFPVPDIPKHTTVYSGDIHTPQTIKNVTYVGAPHFVKFGDSYKCRMLLIQDTGGLNQEILLQPIQKKTLRITSVEELAEQNLTSGDQINVQFIVDPNRVEQWPLEQEQIIDWAKERGIEIVSLAGDCAPGHGVSQPLGEFLEGLGTGDVAEVLAAFCAAEGLESAIVEIGKNLLVEGLGSATCTA